MDSSIGLPIGIGAALILASIFFWCTYRNQAEPEGGRKSEDQLNAIYAAKIKHEIELETQNASKNNEDETLEQEPSNYKITSQSF